jgi:hypothetical protein
VLIGALLVGNAATTELSGKAAELQKSIAETQAAEAVKTDAIIAEGGGAVKGHTVSPELCMAISGFVAAGGSAAASLVISPELIAATEALAAVESPNQKVYAGYVNLVKDPGSIASIADAQAVSADFVKAAQADLATCA